MVRRSLFISPLLLLTFAGAISPIARADDTAGDVDSVKFNYVGQITANGVAVHSGPREDSYPTMKLDKGAQVTVVGMKFNWLKIKPPEGSFAYVGKVYIERRGNGSIGRAIHETSAKAGSVLMTMKTAPMGKIEANQDVTILGEQDEYFKIAPPEGSVVYINKQFVEVLKAIPKQVAIETKKEPTTLPTGDAHDPRVDQNADGQADATPENRTLVDVPAPTTQHSEASAAAANEFQQLESDYAAESTKSISDQSIAKLQGGYETLLKEEALPPSMRRIAQLRQSTLKIRFDAQQEFREVQKSQAQSKEREKAILAERQEIDGRIKQNSVTVYAVVGTLRTSSIQHAGQILYRLADPESGHTVAYLRAPDARYAALLGQFVGVKGTIATDDALQMKIVDNATAVEPVDPSKVNTSIAAQLTPASLIAKPASASAAGE